jgi:cobalamin biosynthesis protein CbiG
VLTPAAAAAADAALQSHAVAHKTALAATDEAPNLHIRKKEKKRAPNEQASAGKPETYHSTEPERSTPALNVSRNNHHHHCTAAATTTTHQICC